VDSEIETDWLQVDSLQFWKTNVTARDMPQEDYRYDAVRMQYWIRNPSPTATILALKGVRFGPKWGQSVW